MSLSFAISSLIIVSILGGALFGFIRGYRRTIVTLISVVVAALISFAFSAIIAKAFINSESIVKLFTTFDMMELYNELSGVSPALIELLGALPVAVVAPILFVILFFILKFIFMIPCVIVCKIMNIVKKEEMSQRLLGIPLGALQGFVVALIPVLILAGYFNVVDRMMTVIVNEEAVEVSEASSESGYEEINAYLEDIKKDPAIVILCNNQGKNNFVFNSLSKFKFRGERVSLPNEIIIITDSFMQLEPLMNNGGESTSISEKEITALENFVDKFGESKVLTEVGAEIIAGACQSWANNEDFMGVSFSGVDENIDPIIFALFDCIESISFDKARIINIGMLFKAVFLNESE